MLTSYNGKSFSYDTIGNLTSDGTWNYTWAQGRQLATMSKSGTTWTFTYDANGMRTKRTTGSTSTTYNYTYNGSQLTHMTYGSNSLHFYYDASGKPLSVVYNGTTYYYILSLQGDVVAILNSSGVSVVEYTYDAWGRLLSTTGSMSGTLGLNNPLRYRGYVYDRETGLYYLQSRYYNPQFCRFISADTYVSTGQSILGHNMFAYCLNNPVNLSDPTGNFAIGFWMASIIGGAIAGAVVNLASYGYANNNPTVEGVITALAMGALSGAFGGLASAAKKYTYIPSLLSGVASGLYTYFTAEGPIEQKVLAGVSSFAFTAGAAYLGTKIPLDGLPDSYVLGGNAVFGMTIGGYLEGGNIIMQGWINESFGNHPLKNVQSTMSAGVAAPSVRPICGSVGRNLIQIRAQ